jgi:nucleotide-binding universal stress UspA family protein
MIARMFPARGRQYLPFGVPNREEPPMSWAPKKKVVVPVDFSEESFAAVDEALGMVSDASSLHVIHVLPLIGQDDPALLWAPFDEEAAADGARREIERRLSDPRYEGHQVTIAFGSAGTEIAAHAERIGADLIVLPSHGRTGLKRLLIGSVAERVVRLAPCPVLVLRRTGGGSLERAVSQAPSHERQVRS